MWRLVADPGADLKSTAFTSLLQYTERQIYYPGTDKHGPGRFSEEWDFFPMLSTMQWCALTLFSLLSATAALCSIGSESENGNPVAF